MLMISSEDKRDYNVPISSLSPADVERPREHDRNYPIFSKFYGLHFRGAAFHQSRHIFHLARLHTSIWHAFIHRYCDILEQTSAADSLRVYMQRTLFASATQLNVRITTSEFTSRCCTPWSRLRVQHFTSIGRPS